MSTAANEFVSKSGGLVTYSDTVVAPEYFTPVYVSGAEITNYGSGSLVPLVALYKINWAAYNANQTKTP
jgi:hypothetical protein